MEKSDILKEWKLNEQHSYIITTKGIMSFDKLETKETRIFTMYEISVFRKNDCKGTFVILVDKEAALKAIEGLDLLNTRYKFDQWLEKLSYQTIIYDLLQKQKREAEP